jgi:hypothetical protein
VSYLNILCLRTSFQRSRDADASITIKAVVLAPGPGRIKGIASSLIHHLLTCRVIATIRKADTNMQTVNRLSSLPHAKCPTSSSVTVDPKYCRHCFPSFEIPAIDALNARRTGVWVPFVDPVYGNRMQVHGRSEEVLVCTERDAGVALVEAMKTALGKGDCSGILIGA